MKELEERARRVLDVVRDRHNPAPADAARVRAALQARVWAEPALLQVSSRPALEARLLRKLLLAFGVGGGAGFAAGLYVAQAVAPAPAMHVVEAPATARPVAVAASAADDIGGSDGKVAASVAASEETRSHTSAVHEPGTSAEGRVPPVLADSRRKPLEPPGSAARSAQTPTLSGPNPLKAELDGLRRAQELLHQGEPAWALARLNELDRAQVGSVLLEERAATRAIAECLLGGDPKAQASEFERRFPRSAHLEQVRSSCSRAHQNGTSSAPVQPAQTETPASRHE
ncbi:MAG: hypothetical protein ABI895_33530 [Deltaproteobacteria bacterium]